MWSTKEFNEKINAQPIIESLIAEREERLKKVQNFEQQRNLQNDILENLVNDISNNGLNTPSNLRYSLSVPIIYHEFFDSSNNLSFNNLQFNSSP